MKINNRPISDKAFYEILKSYHMQMWYGNIREVVTPATIKTLENISLDTNPENCVLDDFDNFIEECVFSYYKWTSTPEGIKEYLVEMIINEDDEGKETFWSIGDTYKSEGKKYECDYSDMESFILEVNPYQVIKVCKKCWDRACTTEEIFPSGEADRDKKIGFFKV